VANPEHLNNEFRDLLEVPAATFVGSLMLHGYSEPDAGQQADIVDAFIAAVYREFAGEVTDPRQLSLPVTLEEVAASAADQENGYGREGFGELVATVV
jgi:hypothetical protein